MFSDIHENLKGCLTVWKIVLLIMFKIIIFLFA